MHGMPPCSTCSWEEHAVRINCWAGRERRTAPVWRSAPSYRPVAFYPTAAKNATAQAPPQTGAAERGYFDSHRRKSTDPTGRTGAGAGKLKLQLQLAVQVQHSTCSCFCHRSNSCGLHESSLRGVLLFICGGCFFQFILLFGGQHLHVLCCKSMQSDNPKRSKVHSL